MSDRKLKTSSRKAKTTATDAPAPIDDLLASLPSEASDDADFVDLVAAADPAVAPALPPDEFSGAIALKRALPKSIVARFRRGASTALLVHAPSSAWCGPLLHAAKALLGAGRSVDFSHAADSAASQSGLLYFVRDAPDRLGRADQSGSGLQKCLSSGGSAIGISPDPSWLPRQLVEAADADVAIAPLRGRDVARIIRATTRCTRCPKIDDGLAAAVSPAQIALAVRVNTTPSACLRRLRAIASRSLRNDAVVDAPPLEDLAGYGEAADFGMALKADIEARRKDPASVSLDTITRSLLLAGAPGAGKSLFASALAKSCGIPLISASYADWQAGDKHLGQVMQNMRESFSNARDAARASGVGAILFIDELDSMPGRDGASGDRHASWWSSIVNTLLTLAERGSPARRGVVLIGATNFAERIDPALRRAGRLDRTIHLRPPDAAAFAAMLRTHLGADLPGADLVALARLAPGLTGADAARIVRDARQTARLAGRALTITDLVGQVIPAESRPRAQVARIARHEAAHALIGLALGAQNLVSLTLAAAPGAEGAARFSTIPGHPQSRAHLEALVVTGLAGRAADEAFGEADAGAGGGPGSDLANASVVVALMHRSFGLGGTLVSLAEPRDAVALLGADGELRATVERDLKRLYARAQAMVAARRTEIEMVAAALVRKRFLSGDEVRALLKRVRSAAPTRLVTKGRMS